MYLKIQNFEKFVSSKDFGYSLTDTISDRGTSKHSPSGTSNAFNFLESSVAEGLSTKSSKKVL